MTLRPVKPQKKSGRKGILYLAAIGLIAAIGLLWMSGFTGFLVSTESFYTAPGFDASQSGEFVWSPEQQGQLTSVKLTGYIMGNGSVKVYLKAGEMTFLILDRPGFTEGNESIPVQENQTQANESADEIPPPENITAEASGSITGNQIAGPANESISIPEDNASLESPEANATSDASEGLNASDEIPPPENVTEPDENATNNQAVQTSIESFHFQDMCMETCSIDGVNESSYALTFEIENGTGLHIESMRYSIVTSERENLPPAGEVPSQRMEIGQTLTLNLSLYFTNPENGNLVYSLNEWMNYSFIENDTLTLIPQEEGNFTINLSVTDGSHVVFSTFSVLVYPNVTAQPLELSCSSCSDCTEKAGYAPSGSSISLDSDMESLQGSCIQISGAKNLTLNCKGHSISGSGEGCGIQIVGSSDNTFKNCVIEGFYAGLHMDRDSRHNSILAMTASDNEYGVSVFSSSSNSLEGIAGKIRVSSSSRNAISCG